jgi:hypothetical protein
MQDIDTDKLDLIIEGFCNKHMTKRQFISSVNEFVQEEIYDIELDEEVFGKEA